MSNGRNEARIGPRNPWDQLDKETSKSFAAFNVYLNLGEARSVEAAFQARKGYTKAPGGPEKVARPTGAWRTWYHDNQWKVRALAWDRHQADIRNRATIKAVEKQAKDWAQERQAQCEQDLRIARNFLKQAEAVSLMPLVRRTNTADGHTTIIEPVSPRDAKDAATLALTASGLAWNAILEQLNDPDVDFDIRTAPTEQLKVFLDRAPDRRRA